MTSTGTGTGTTHGIDHARLAARSRVAGALYAAERRFRAEVPFVPTFLLAAFGNPVAYLAAMGIGLGSLVKADVGGVGYLAFVAPALLVSTVATTGSSWGTWLIMSGFKWEKNFLAAAATALTPGQIAWGEAISVAIRLLFQGLVFWVLGWAFGAWSSPWSLLTVPLGALAGMAFFAPLAAFSATLENEGVEFNIISRLVLTPMFLFAGTFFPLESMPPYLQWIGWISPMWHGTQLSRIASYGMPSSPLAIVGHLAFLVGLTVVGMILARITFTRRVLS